MSYQQTLDKVAHTWSAFQGLGACDWRLMLGGSRGSAGWKIIFLLCSFVWTGCWLMQCPVIKMAGMLCIFIATWRRLAVLEPEPARAGPAILPWLPLGLAEELASGLWRGRGKSQRGQDLLPLLSPFSGQVNTSPLPPRMKVPMGHPPSGNLMISGNV
jgi:hypothetical protein